MNKGHSGITSNDWNEVLNRTQLKCPDLIRDQIEYVFRGMLTRALCSKLTMTHPSDLDVDALLHALTTPKIDDVPGRMDDPSTNETKKNLLEYVPSSTFVPKEHPQNSPLI